MIERLAIFGATGDLTARYLLPGLAALQAAGQLGRRFQLAGAGREEWDTGGFRQWAAAQLDRHGGQFPDAARQAVVSASSYHRADVADVPSVANVIAGDGPVAAYLALPPAVLPVAVSALHDAGHRLVRPPRLAGMQQRPDLGQPQPAQGLAEPLGGFRGRLEVLGLEQVA